MSSCPDVGILCRLGVDTLTETSYAAVEEHVEGCERCAAILERLAHRRDGAPPSLPGPGRTPDIPGFSIRRELGRGATGVVYLAVEEGLDRPVALKVIPAAGADGGPGARRRWLREARAVARIRHPNVLTLYDYGEADGWLYLVLEYVPGGTLKRRLEGPLPPRAAAHLVETVARAVGGVHGRGLLHLDLKPSNILLDGEMDAAWERVIPRVSDFGLAVDDSDAGPAETSLAGIRGTPAYMAPEQADAARRRIGAAADIHALGAVLYELLTGRPPFQGATTLETLDQVRHQEPVPPRRLNPRIARDLETIALKCLEKDPSRRYASAEALADDLRSWLDGRPIAARPVSPPEKVWRRCRRRPAVAALAAALLISLGCGFVGMLALWSHAESQRRRAEWERSRAEADFQTTIEVLGQLIDPIVPSETHQAVTPAERIAILRQTRESLLVLAVRRPDRSEILRKLGVVDRALGYSLMAEGSLDEARSRFEESLGRCEELLRKDRLDGASLRDQVYTLIGLARLTDAQGRSDEGLGHLRRAVAVGESRVRHRPDGDAIALLAETRDHLARLLERRGDREQARSVVEANRRLLDEVPAEAEGPRVAAWRERARSARDRLGSVDPELLPRLAAWGTDHLTSEGWAERTAQALAAARPGRSPAEESRAGYELVEFLFTRAADHRRHDRLDEAGRTADRMLAFARLLVARHPDQPAAHLALCTAYAQFSKNAWPIDDRATIERSMRLALDAAIRALALDPVSRPALGAVERFARRLEGLRHPR